LLGEFKMNLIKEQRVCVKFRFRLGKTATKTLQLLQTAYGEEALSRTCFEWCKRFKEDKTSIEDDQRRWRPSTKKNQENVTACAISSVPIAD
jgi:hypothetical protein